MKSNSLLRFGAPLAGEPHPVLQWIEVASFLQIPQFQIIGLPAPEVAEARERVRAAIASCGLSFPKRRVVVNLSPASVRKRGTGLDLAMALAILSRSAVGGASVRRALTVVAWGELGLDGTVKGVQDLTRTVYAAWEARADLVIVSADEEAIAQERLGWLLQSRLLSGDPPTLVSVKTLAEAWSLVQNFEKRGPSLRLHSNLSTLPPILEDSAAEALLPLSPSMERLLGISAAGAHPVLLLGPRGTGKSHALEWLIALQPPVSLEIRMQHALLEELSGQKVGLSPQGVPVRRVGASVRPAALLGGVSGFMVRPGEFSLAHGGLLIADELPEWARDARETLREPLERGVVTLTRSQKSVELPAKFVLAASGNFCPCGGWPPELPRPLELQGRNGLSCRCGTPAAKRYLAKLSGPLLDRMDLVALVAGTTAFSAQAQLQARQQLTRLRARVIETRARSLSKWGSCAGQLTGAELERLILAHPHWLESLRPEFFSSLRARHKILRVALTLAMWDGAAEPGPGHLIEASLYRAERFGLIS